MTQPTPKAGQFVTPEIMGQPPSLLALCFVAVRGRISSRTVFHDVVGRLDLDIFENVRRHPTCLTFLEGLAMHLVEPEHRKQGLAAALITGHDPAIRLFLRMTTDYSGTAWLVTARDDVDARTKMQAVDRLRAYAEVKPLYIAAGAVMSADLEFLHALARTDMWPQTLPFPLSVLVYRAIRYGHRDVEAFLLAQCPDDAHREAVLEEALVPPLMAADLDDVVAALIERGVTDHQVLLAAARTGNVAWLDRLIVDVPTRRNAAFAAVWGGDDNAAVRTLRHIHTRWGLTTTEGGHLLGCAVSDRLPAVEDFLLTEAGAVVDEHTMTWLVTSWAADTDVARFIRRTRPGLCLRIRAAGLAIRYLRPRRILALLGIGPAPG